MLPKESCLEGDSQLRWCCSKDSWQGISQQVSLSIKAGVGGSQQESGRKVSL